MQLFVCVYWHLRLYKRTLIGFFICLKWMKLSTTGQFSHSWWWERLKKNDGLCRLRPDNGGLRERWITLIACVPRFRTDNGLNVNKLTIKITITFINQTHALFTLRKHFFAHKKSTINTVRSQVHFISTTTPTNFR